MHDRVGEDARGLCPEQLGDTIRTVSLSGVDSTSARVAPSNVDLAAELRQHAGAEHDARGLSRIDERVMSSLGQLTLTARARRNCASTLTHTLLTCVYSRIASKAISRP